MDRYTRMGGSVPILFGKIHGQADVAICGVVIPVIRHLDDSKQKEVTSESAPFLGWQARNAVELLTIAAQVYQKVYSVNIGSNKSAYISRNFQLRRASRSLRQLPASTQRSVVQSGGSVTCCLP